MTTATETVCDYCDARLDDPCVGPCREAPLARAGAHYWRRLARPGSAHPVARCTECGQHPAAPGLDTCKRCAGAVRSLTRNSPAGYCPDGPRVIAEREAQARDLLACGEARDGL